MKEPCSGDRLMMAVLYFLSSIILGSARSGKDAPSVERFFLRVVNDLDSCKKFPWGRFAFEQKCKGVVGITNWVITSFTIPLDDMMT